MELEQTEVFLSKDGKMDALESYILIVPSNDQTEIYSSSTLYQDCMAAMAMWDNFAKKLAKLPDQDIFEFCKDYDLDYDTTIAIAREARNNG